MFETLYFTKFPNNGLILLPRSCAVEAQRRPIAYDPALARPVKPWVCLWQNGAGASLPQPC